MRYHIVFILLIWLLSCQSPPSPIVSFANTIMTIDYRILVGHPLNESEKKQIQYLIKETFEEINAIYNKWNPESEVSKINQLKAGERVLLSPSLYHFLQQVDFLVQLTGGRFDPTIEPLQNLWKTYLKQGQVPPQAAIDHLKNCVGWDKIHLDNGLFYKDNSCTQLDLGGIAKGLCVDLLVERLNQAGYSNVYVEWGGEIRTSGQHPSKRPWTIYISRLGDSNPTHALAYLHLQDRAIATSGDYLQYWKVKSEDQDIYYSHVFNPLTLRPLIVTSQSVASASVACDRCMWADGLATAALLFPSPQEAEEWIISIKDRFPSVESWIISREDLILGRLEQTSKN
jgi:FAD:protein FMN transferase